jgi:hypothetical protein
MKGCSSPNYTALYVGERTGTYTFSYRYTVSFRFDAGTSCMCTVLVSNGFVPVAIFRVYSKAVYRFRYSKHRTK